MECAAVASRLIENLHGAAEISSIQEGRGQVRTDTTNIDFRLEPYILIIADCAMYETLLQGTRSYIKIYISDSRTSHVIPAWFILPLVP
jgi:hypothetical protein